MSHRVLVLGGARSGKSRFAESLLVTAAGQGEADYVATSLEPADDDEWRERVRAHRARRPPAWRTVETGDLVQVLAIPAAPALIDSISAWLARAMDDAGCWSAGEQPGALARRVDDLCAAWERTQRTVVAVSDEVGSGIVPGTPAGRRFRDELGALNQLLAATADEVHLVVAGLPLRLR